MPARVLDVADAAAAEVRRRWNPAGHDAVLREYAPDLGLSGGDDPARGSKVYVFPAAYAAPGWETRARLERTYTVAVLVVERHPGGGRPPKEWMDDRVTWAEAAVYDVLRDPDLVLLDAVTPDPANPGTADAVFDLDVFAEHGAFWAEFTFTFWEAR